MQQLARLNLGPEWKGLLSRRQDLDLDPNWAETARNVEFYGGLLAKRAGTQYVNGWGAIALGDWVNVPVSDFILDVSHLDVDTLGGPMMRGSVVDGAGFQKGDVVTITDGTQVHTGLGTIFAIHGNVIELAGSQILPRLNDCLIVRHPLDGTNRVDGLFQATFRSGQQFLLAACGSGIFSVLQAPAPSVRIPESFPATTVDVTWSNTTTGTLTNVETIRGSISGIAGEYIRIAGAGVGGAVYEGRVITVVFATRTITVSPPTVTPPTSGAVVTLFPTRVPGDTHFVQYANETHIVSEHTPAVKFTGSVLQRHGVLPPIAPVPVTIVAGTLTGTWTWRIKFRNSVTGQESEPGPEMVAPMTLAGQGASLVITRSPDPQVDKIRIYRTTDGGAGAWYFDAEIPNPPTLTVTYVDNVPDDQLGILMREFVDDVLPDAVADHRFVSVLSLWPGANCLIGIDQGLGVLVYSDQFDLEEGFLKGEAWPAVNQLFLNYDDGDKPRAVAAFFDSLLAFKARSVFRIIGIPPVIEIQPVIFRQDLTGVGAFNQKAVVVDQDHLIFPGQDGFYAISRYQGVQQGFQSERLSRQIDTEFERLTEGQQRKTHALFFRQRRQLRSFFPMDGHGEPSENLVYQFEGSVEGQPHGWSEWSVPTLPDGLGVNPFRLDFSRLDVDTLGPLGPFPLHWPLGYTASAVTQSSLTGDAVVVGTVQGDVLRMDVGTAEAGCMPYPFRYTTTWFAPAGQGYVARGRSLNLVVVPRTSTALIVTMNTQFLGGRQMVVPVSPPGGFKLDVSRLDIDRLGGAPLKQGVRGVLLSLGDYHQLDFKESSAVASFGLQTVNYFFQALPATVRPQQVVQAL